MRRLSPLDATTLSQLLASQSAEYAKRFTPFAYDFESVYRQLNDAQQDVFAGAFVVAGTQRTLAGLWLLRGWDQGYTVPAFGLMVDGAWAGYGIGATCLQAGIVTAKLRGAKQVMSKVHVVNKAAYRLNEAAGFVVTERNGDVLTMHREL